MPRKAPQKRSTAKPQSTPRRTGTVLRNSALEAAVLAQPEDLDVLSVYADWLQSNHQPLGEVIALNIAAETEPQLRSNATRALTAYIEDHLAPAYPKLAARMLSYKLAPNRKARDGIGHGQTLSILWRHGLIDSIGTWQWDRAMNEELFDLF